LKQHAYLPQTAEDVQDMLAAAGATSLDDLFRDVPPELLGRHVSRLPAGAPEVEVRRRLWELAAGNRTDRVSFLGGGCYDHHIPAVVDHLSGRSEFSTAYTPYQAEIAQGMLQAVFEFQTMIAELCALDVSNASLYDGATAVCEAVAMALGSVRKARVILYAGTLHPATKRVLRTHFSFMDVELQEVPAGSGVLDPRELERRLEPGVAALVIQSPNYLGYLEPVRQAAEAAHAVGALLIQSANPLSLGVLDPPGELGADIAVGDAQPLGLPQSYGGPTVGFIAAREALLRRLPGRIVGQSVDREGRRAYLLTLQAREQHIKRERATSNICSNQALAALAVTVHLATLGPQGLQETAEQCVQKAHYLHDRMARELPVQPVSDGPFFNEFALRLRRDPAEVVRAMESEGFYAGIPLAALEPGRYDGLLGVAVTERRTRAEMDRYVDAMRRVLHE
jgi:glycine dehydrogenase subunit 1